MNVYIKDLLIALMLCCLIKLVTFRLNAVSPGNLRDPDRIEEAAMSDKYLDDYLSVIAIDVAVEERTRTARMAVATLHKLHSAMQQMRDWQDDSAKLKSNIWRMKMALRADDESGDDGERIDPLIVHQRTEIGRLEQANGALENEVTNLRRALTKAEEDIARIAVCEIGDKIATLESKFSRERERMNDEILRLKGRLSAAAEGGETSVALKQLRDKLNEFTRGDRTIEMIFANTIGKTVQMVIGLSEELVNVSENLYRFKARNRSLRLKLDRLRAMLRSRCGSSAEYRKRIGELNNLAEQLTEEMDRLRIIRENTGGSWNATDIPDVVKRIERLMNDLRNNLKSDREAMIAAGDPDCLKYMKKVVNLKVNLKVLSVELRRSDMPMDKRLRENDQREKCLEAATSLNDFLREIGSEIEKLKVRPMNKYCKIGGVGVSRYLTKVAELEDAVRESIAVIADLKQAPPGIINTDEKGTGALEESIERLCCKIKQLEVFDDRANLRERIERLEALAVYLKSELSVRNERINALSDERASVRLTLEEDRARYERIIADVRGANEALRGDMNRGKQEISALSRERDRFERRVAELQLMRAEMDAARKESQGLHDDKETLLGEAERLRDALGEKDKEIGNIITRGDALKAVLTAEMEDLKTKLGLASVENVKLRSIIEGLEKPEGRERLGKLKSSEKESGGGEERDNGEDRARNLRDEPEYSKVESNEPKISPDKADEGIGHLKSVPDEAVGDRAKPGGEISDPEPNEQSLTYRLNVRTSGGEAATREFDRVMAEHKASENKVKQLRNEKEQLEKELSELRSEKGLLGRSMADANNKRAALQDQVNKFKSECNGLREKISEHEAAAENLKFELEDAARLRSENSRVLGDLDILSVRRAEAEDRVRVLLTEKKEFATRINELNDESVALRERLNKAREENEYFSMELNKSRVENDKAKAENALLLATCDTRERDNVELRRERDDARGRINEIGNECRVLGNQLRIQRMKYEALRLAAALHDEGNGRKNYFKEIDTQHPLAKDREWGGFARDGIRQKQNRSDVTSGGVEIGELRGDGGTEVKVETDTRVNHDNKAGIRDEPKDELERSRNGNNALKSERANLRSENCEVTMVLAESELKNPTAGVSNGEEIVGSVLKKFGIASIWQEEGRRDYSNYLDDQETGNERAASLDINQLETGNRAPKMKADVSRSGHNFCLTDGESTRTDLGRATEEIQALRLELMNLRDEKAALRSQFEIFKEELSALKSERVALKDELAASRKSNFDLRLKVNDLRRANEKLKETNARLGDRLSDASRGTNEYTAMLQVPDKRLNHNFEGALSDYLQKYIFTERNLRITNRRNQFDHVTPKNPELRSVEKNLHIEGQKF